MSVTRWGIVGPGDIAQRTVADLQNVETIELLGVASRSQARAQEFADQHGLRRAYGSFEAMLADADIDVVYIAVPHSAHAEHTRQALLAGKHVLCEKPFTLDAAQAIELAYLARERGLFLMEAMWMRFSPAMHKAQELISAGELGTVNAATAAFGVAFPAEQSRMWSPQLGGGALLDLGVYTLTFVQMLLGKPTRVDATGTVNADGIDLHETVVLHGEDGAFGVAITSMVGGLTPTATVGGTGGALFFGDPFYSTPTLSLIAMPSWKKTEFTVELEGAGYIPMFRAVSEAVLAGLTEHPLNPLSETIAILETMDEVRRQLGD